MAFFPYRYIGCTVDGLLILEDQHYPTDAPRMFIHEADLQKLHSTEWVFRTRYFAVTERHAEVCGYLQLALEAREKAGAR